LPGSSTKKITEPGGQNELPAKLKGALHIAAYRKGYLCLLTQKYEEAVAFLSTAIAIKPNYAKAYVSLGSALAHLGRQEEAIALYNDMLARFPKASGWSLREQLTMGLFNKGTALLQLGQREEAILVYKDVVTRFGKASETVVREHVVNSLFNMSAALLQLERYEDALTILSDLLARSSEMPKALSREHVAVAYFNKAVAFNMINRYAEAITAYDEFLTRFGKASDWFLREPIAYALNYKADALTALGQKEEAIKAYKEAIERLREDLSRLKQENNNVIVSPGAQLYNAQNLGAGNTGTANALQPASAEKDFDTMPRGDFDKGQKEATAPKVGANLPPLPDGLDWPQDFNRSPHFKKKGGLLRYLEAWRPIIAIGAIDMPLLRQHWPKAAAGVDNHRLEIPEELLIPTIEQANDQKLKSEHILPKDARRLAAAQRRRDLKAKQQSPVALSV
jgi:tetratricopeptide (TPR) repeat protein